MQLLTHANTKILKGEKMGYRTFGIHLSPHKVSGYNVCPSASKGCSESCLNSSGRGIMGNVQEARLKKTLMFFDNKDEFLEKLYNEITTQIRRAKKNNMIPVFRLNLTSDLPWESIKYKGKSMMEHFPSTQFYDYSKILGRMINFLTGKFPKNYHLTFSRSESNEDKCKIVAGMKGNIATVFSNKLPKSRLKRKIVSGMDSDLRFLDPKNSVVGLIAIGKGRRDKSGFVISNLNQHI
jgi:hypothetical protein|tara:strand:+ start:181 stop:891 length:711 start_codon:yes stop_codon:yes gene_type:complete